MSLTTTKIMEWIHFHTSFIILSVYLFHAIAYAKLQQVN